MEIEDLESRTSLKVPKSYKSFIDHSSDLNGFDVKSLCILNLELRDHPGEGFAKDRFFVGEDGFGNYYFIEETTEKSRIKLWSHDPVGIEDVTDNVASFLSNHDWPNVIINKIDVGNLAIYRTVSIGESILNPIMLEEFQIAISKYLQIEYLGFRIMTNPFTQEEIKVPRPGYSKIDTQNEINYINLFSGRLVVQNPNSEAVEIMESLANTLNANISYKKS